MARIGIFVCHCGTNIAGTVDVQAVAEDLRGGRDIAYAVDYPYMCSDPGQALIQAAIESEKLDGIVVAACSPAMHEPTFRRAASLAGLNPFLCEIANIREQCSWVHRDQPHAATQKALEIVASTAKKVRGNLPLEELRLPITRKALVIGGGLAGLTAAAEIAGAGYPVVLVEREESLGGKVTSLFQLYPDFRLAAEIIEPLMRRVQADRRVTIYTCTEVEEIAGYVGNFQVWLRQRGTSEAIQEEVGAIVVATGYELYPKGAVEEYGGGRLANVVDGLEFERLLAQNEDGQIYRPSDGKPAEEVAFIQCAGSRDPERHLPYCSKICCMYIAKQALLHQRLASPNQSYVFYIDVRTAGRRHEEFAQGAMEEGVVYLRGKVSRLYEENGKIVICGADTLSGKQIVLAADIVVLAMGVVPSLDSGQLAQALRISTDEHGFFTEAHPKLRPVESLTAGVYLAGAAQAPKDIPETVAQGEAAAAKVLTLFAQGELAQEPTTAWVEEEVCSGCGLCVELCPYEARTLHPVRGIATVNAALCQGCGACTSACPNKASSLRNFSTEQVLAMIDALL